MRSTTLKNKTNLVINSDIELGEQEGNGKGRYFMSRFIEPGIAHYEELGDILITKETLNKFIQTMVGVPVIIDHEDVTDKNVDKLRVGSVSKVWFNEFDGYFYCEGILTDPEAIDLVKNQGWNVSCAYSFQSVPKDTHNGKKIDLEFIDGEFLHLAIVKNPRYEGANIVVNKNDDVEWITVKGNHIPIKKGQTKDEAVKEFLDSKQSDTKDKSSEGEENKNSQKIKDIIEKHYEDDIISDKYVQELSDELGTKITVDDIYDAMDKSAYSEGSSDYDTKKMTEILEQKAAEKNKKQDKSIEKPKKIKEDTRTLKTIMKSEKKYYKNIYDVTDKISQLEKELKKETDQYYRDDIKDDIRLLKEWKKDFEQANNSIGDITMQVLNELKEFIKNVVSNEKEDEMAVKNEDKRKLIDEIGGILKDKVDDEIIRTVIKKAEELSYEPSEDDKADNKAKNEDKEDKEEAKNKCKNEEDEKEEEIKEDIVEDEDDEEKAENKKVKNSLGDIVMGGNIEAHQSKLYTSRKERLEEGNKY